MTATRWLSGMGVVLIIAGIVALVWTQTSSLADLGGGGRWLLATGPLELSGVGALVVGVAQILGIMLTAREPTSN